MLQILNLVDGPVVIEGAVSLEERSRGIHPYRLRSEERELHDTGLAGRADVASGVRVIVVTDSPVAEIDVTITDSEETASIDAVVGGELVESRGLQPSGKMQTFGFDRLPTGMKTLELWLPMFGHTTVHAVRLADAAQASRLAESRPRWLTYGSSITMCRQAHSPARTWPAVVARKHGLNLTSFGVGGQCHFDPIVARTMRDLPADIISLKLGINTYGGSSYTARTWGPAVLGFIMTIRDGHPDVPILVCSPIHAIDLETAPNRSEMTLGDMRQTLAEIVTKLRTRGDSNIHYLDGRSLLGPEDAEECLMPDGVHPNGNGYELMGERFAEIAFAPLGPFVV